MNEKRLGVWSADDIDSFYKHIKGHAAFWAGYRDEELKSGPAGKISLDTVTYIASAAIRFYPGRAKSGQEALLVKSVRLRARRELGLEDFYSE